MYIARSREKKRWMNGVYLNVCCVLGERTSSWVGLRPVPSNTNLHTTIETDRENQVSNMDSSMLQDQIG